MGILRAGGGTLSMRCSNCRYSVKECLPSLNKKVIYLDQFVFSSLFNLQSGRRVLPGHDVFFKKLGEKLHRLVLLQQIVLPNSNIHRDETTVFHSAADLTESSEFLGGDIVLIDTDEVELNQTLETAEVFLAGKSVGLNFSVDEILEEDRNQWLSDMHISVRSEYSVFGGQLRRARDETHSAMENLANRWARDRPSFTDVLQNEFDSILTGKVNALADSERRKRNPDPMTAFEAFHCPIQREVRALLGLMAEKGVPAGQAGQTVRDFWSSSTNRNLPHHRISSYLFAAVARRVVQGQKSIINRGLMNDIRAIACYAPYVDAMFVDKDCAQLLGEKLLESGLEYKAHIFSLADTDAFLMYLDEIEAATPPRVREFAARIYGVS